MRALALVVVAIVTVNSATTRRAVAQPSAPLQPGGGTPAAKSPELAVALSAGITLGGFALATGDNDETAMLGLLAMYVGPSTGIWYGGNVALSAPGLAARALSAAMLLKGLALMESSELTDCLGVDDQAECDRYLAQAEADYTRGERYTYASLIVWTASTLVDLGLAHHATKRWNERNVTITPTLVGDGPGLSFSGAF